MRGTSKQERASDFEQVRSHDSRPKRKPRTIESKVAAQSRAGQRSVSKSRRNVFHATSALYAVSNEGQPSADRPTDPNAVQGEEKDEGKKDSSVGCENRPEKNLAVSIDNNKTIGNERFNHSPREGKPDIV